MGDPLATVQNRREIELGQTSLVRDVQLSKKVKTERIMTITTKEKILEKISKKIQISIFGHWPAS